MSKLKVSELFYSIQGEGRYVGVPSVFLRLFGCNFTCASFGMPLGSKSEERNNISAEGYSRYTDLPLVSTGCDSYASWDPRFKHLSPIISSKELASSIVDLLPNKNFVDEHLVITGGEPLLSGWQKALPDLLEEESLQSLKEITFETNGTQPLSPEFLSYLQDWNKVGREITFSVSPKLSVSGERWVDAIKPECVAEYETVGYTYLKFVVASRYDAAEAQRATSEYRKVGFEGPVYLMPVGGTEESYYLNNKQVAELALKLGYRYSPRLQVDLFGNAWNT